MGNPAWVWALLCTIAGATMVTVERLGLLKLRGNGQHSNGILG